MLLTVKQVSHELNFSEQQIYRWATQGALQARHFGRALRFDPEEVERVKKTGLVPGVPEINLLNGRTCSGRSRVPALHRKGVRLWER
jgi:excisionase family DNA binding protein